MSQPPPPDGGSLAQIIAERRRRVEELAARGVHSWGVDFTPDHSCAAAAELAPAETGAEGPPVRVAGRVLRLRPSGGITFADCFDSSGRLQLLARREVTPEETMELLEDIDLGDLVGAEGRMVRTRRGEPSVELDRLVLLAKSLRPPASKHRGLVDPELRYRRRYLDLLSEPARRTPFRQRSAIVSAVRRVMDGRGYMEVETPILQAIPGGGEARPFVTHHHALGADLYLRIALELHLKRLLVAGFERVYEVGRVFRNEGVSPRHNPEFTLLEAYQAYGNLTSMMDLSEAVVAAAAEAAVALGPVAESIKRLQPPFARSSMLQLVEAAVGVDPLRLWDRPGALAALALEKGVAVDPTEPPGKVLFLLYESLVEPQLADPIFVTDYPIEVSPLARRGRDPRFCERFELVVGGRELANAFSELNDPLDQRQRMEEQARRRRLGDQEAHPFDEDFVEALEHGMPPAGGIGIGIDRLVMVVLGATNIRDVVLFPTLRPEEPRDPAPYA